MMVRKAIAIHVCGATARKYSESVQSESVTVALCICASMTVTNILKVSKERTLASGGTSCFVQFSVR